MTHLNDAIEEELAVQQTESLWSAIIADTATSTTQELAVTIPGLDDSVQFGPCRWMPRVHTVTINVAEGVEATHNISVAQLVLPTRGDRALVAFDDEQRPWIVCWWPA